MTFFSSSTTNFEFPCFSTFSRPPVSRKLLFPPTFLNFPSVLSKFTCFLHTFCVFRFPPTLTIMHLCITQCMYWTPLDAVRKKCRGLSTEFVAFSTFFILNNINALIGEKHPKCAHEWLDCK